MRRIGSIVINGVVLIGLLAVPPATAIAADAMVSSISSGGAHSCALKTDSSVWCWGDAYYGQTGDGTVGDASGLRLQAVRVVLPNSSFSGVKAVTAGGYHTCALKNDATVWCWGYDVRGAVGDGTTGDAHGLRRNPTAVPYLNGIQAVSAGLAHTCAVTNITPNEIKCWGDDSVGQLGDGTTGDANHRRLGPVFVLQSPGTQFHGIDSVSSGYTHTCALTYLQTVWCWGDDSSGQLGDGTTGDANHVRLYPVQVLQGTGQLSDVKAITTGAYHSCALKTDGTTWCWGYAGYGELGDGTTGDANHLHLRATQVALGNTGKLTNVSTITAGAIHTCATRTDGSAWCWGLDDTGQIGDGTVGDSNHVRLKPVRVRLAMGDLANISLASAGANHSCALRTDGAVWCWGYDLYGQLGDGTTGDGHYRRLYPGRVTRTNAPMLATNLSSGWNQSCAAAADGSAWCWGLAGDGEIGDGTTGNENGRRLLASQVAQGIATLSQAESVSSGGNQSCTVKTDGSGWCWGSDSYGQVGDGTLGDANHRRLKPVQVVQGTGKMTGVGTLSAGAFHTCALKTTGAVWCWGRASSGQVGDGTIGDSQGNRARPVQVIEGGGKLTGVSQISAGGSHTCALKNDSTVWCWGSDAAGQLGDGTTGGSSHHLNAPVQVALGSGLLTDATAIATGNAHSCAIRVDTTVWCWGAGNVGQLGDGTMGSNRLKPVQVGGGLTGGTAVSAVGDHTCALRNEGTVWCWGDDSYGQIGDGTLGNGTYHVLLPAQVVFGGGKLGGVAAISAGGFHTCALKTDNTVWCWGDAASGQIGNGTTGNPQHRQPTPVQVLQVVWL